MKKQVKNILSESDKETALNFLYKTALTLHKYGAAAHRLEQSMTRTSEELGMESTFFSTPTGLFASTVIGKDTKTVILRSYGSEINLSRLCAADRIACQVVSGSISIDEGIKSIDNLEKSPPRYGTVLNLFAMSIVSAMAARFFGGGIVEIILAGIIGLIIGLLGSVMNKRPRFSLVYEALAAFVAGFTSAMASILFEPVSSDIVTLAGLIILVPGLTITMAMTELATKHLSSGTARLSNALAIFLMIGFGVTLGTKLGHFGETIVSLPVSKVLPAYTEWIALIIASFLLAIIFQADKDDIFFILLAGIIAYSSAKLGIMLIGSATGVFVAAFILGITSTIHSKIRNKPSVVMLLPGVLLLVPGSIGFRSISELMNEDILSGVQSAFSVAVVAISLVAGLLLANVVLPPRRPL